MPNLCFQSMASLVFYLMSEMKTGPSSLNKIPDYLIIDPVMVIEERQQRDEGLLKSLLDIWGESVPSTHHFLNEAAIKDIRSFAKEAIAFIPHLLVAYNDDQPIGFLGVEGRKVAMLFIDPAYQHQGIGTALLKMAITKWAINEVDVNEDNEAAHCFYLSFGFVDISRKEKDDQGNPYPIVTMCLSNNGDAANEKA